LKHARPLSRHACSKKPPQHLKYARLFSRHAYSKKPPQHGQHARPWDKATDMSTKPTGSPRSYGRRATGQKLYLVACELVRRPTPEPGAGGGGRQAPPQEQAAALSTGLDALRMPELELESARRDLDDELRQLRSAWAAEQEKARFEWLDKQRRNPDGTLHVSKADHRRQAAKLWSQIVAAAE